MIDTLSLKIKTNDKIARLTELIADNNAMLIQHRNLCNSHNSSMKQYQGEPCVLDEITETQEVKLTIHITHGQREQSYDCK